MNSTLYLGLGSNLGDRNANLQCALTALERHHIAIEAVSPWYENPPVGMAEGAEWFLNGAVKARTALTPLETLHHLREIERECGRSRSPDASGSPLYEPRTLDLDLLLWEDQLINLPELIVPHPRMHLRPFVLAPLKDIAAEVLHPVKNKTIAELWHECDDKNTCILWKVR